MLEFDSILCSYGDSEDVAFLVIRPTPGTFDFICHNN